MTAVQVSARVDKEIKEEAQKVFARQGLDISVAIKMFITKTANEHRIPLSLEDNYYSPRRQAIRKEISSLADEKSPVLEIDWNNQKDVEALLSDW